MTVETERASDGHVTFRLGPVERWVVGLGAAALVAGGYRIYSTFSDRMDAQSKAQQDTVTQLAVMNSQLAVMNTQLADVPGLSMRITKLETNQAELIRRVGRLEDGGSTKAKGWTR
jgi:hypothetical protein